MQKSHSLVERLLPSADWEVSKYGDSATAIIDGRHKTFLARCRSATAPMAILKALVCQLLFIEKHKELQE